jgi:hypothetical protein
MGTRISNQADFSAVETIIDQIGIESTLMLIAAVCAAKAEHIATSYDDRTLAEHWDRAGVACTMASDDSSIRYLSDD